MAVDRKAIRRDAYRVHPLILHLIFIAFKLDGELFAAVTFATSLDPMGRCKRVIKLLFPSAPYHPASTGAIKMCEPD